MIYAFHPISKLRWLIDVSISMILDTPDFCFCSISRSSSSSIHLNIHLYRSSSLFTSPSPDYKKSSIWMCFLKSSLSAYESWSLMFKASLSSSKALLSSFKSSICETRNSAAILLSLSLNNCVIRSFASASLLSFSVITD